VAQHKSAVKRIRRNDRARVRNRQYLAAVKTAVKKFRMAVLGAGQGTFDKGAVRPLFVNAQSMLAKAATKGVLHKNNVARKIGRLSAMLKAAEAGVVAAADQKVAKKSAAVRRQEAAEKAPAAAADKAPKAAAAKKPAAKATKATAKTAAKKPAPKKK
jgi:small subunit ribosomal protein S20